MRTGCGSDDQGVLHVVTVRSVYTPTPSSKARFYHVYLDVRAFVTSPCSPGEIAELYFLLYNEADDRFLTEEFCVYLNHNGVLARDPTVRIKTSFTDLVQSDVQDPICLVCRIVRNDAMKMSTVQVQTLGMDDVVLTLRFGMDLTATQSPGILR